MRFIAQDLREWMAKIGVRTVDEMIGHVEFLTEKESHAFNHIDLSQLLYQPKICSNDFERYHTENQNHELEKAIDMNTLLRLCEPALSTCRKIEARLGITNRNRAVGAVLSSEIARRYGEEGLPDDTISLTFEGTAGQSFGSFLAPGVTLRLEGDCNDYIGKGLSGGRIIVVTPENAAYNPSENVIIGNVAFYGAVRGESYIRGIAGERFCVRNSGMTAVVEGVGEHGCEYMTGGRVVILGSVGRNFAAGMSGGVAYIYDISGTLEKNCNRGMVEICGITDDEDITELRHMLEKHLRYTGSDIAQAVLCDFENKIKLFKKVIPADYKKVMDILKEENKKGTDSNDALLIAFEAVTGKKIPR